MEFLRELFSDIDLYEDASRINVLLQEYLNIFKISKIFVGASHSWALLCIKYQHQQHWAPLGNNRQKAPEGTRGRRAAADTGRHHYEATVITTEQHYSTVQRAPSGNTRFDHASGTSGQGALTDGSGHGNPFQAPLGTIRQRASMGTRG